MPYGGRGLNFLCPPDNKNVNYNDLFPFKLLDILRFREQNEQENILYGHWEKMTSHETFVEKFKKLIKDYSFKRKMRSFKKVQGVPKKWTFCIY